MGQRWLRWSGCVHAAFKRALLASLLAAGAGETASVDQPADPETPPKGAWFLYDLDGERQVRIDYLGPAMGRHHVARTFLGGQAYGHVDVYLAPQSLLGCVNWPPATGDAGTCRVKRSVGARDYWTDVGYRVSDDGGVEVPAGRFEALRIEVRMQTDSKRVQGRSTREVWWYAPSLNWPVRYRFGRTGPTAVLVDHGVALPGQRRRQAGDRSRHVRDEQ